MEVIKGFMKSRSEMEMQSQMYVGFAREISQRKTNSRKANTEREIIMKANNKVVIKRKGSCKKVVRDDGRHWDSVHETANELNVHISAVSYALRHGTKCKGHHFYYETQAYKYVPVVMRNLVTTTEENESIKAENETLKAKADAWDRYVAEKEVEERRLVREAEAHDKAVAKQEAKVAKLEAKYDRKKEALQKALREEQEVYAEYCKEIEKLNELNANMTVNWEVIT